MIDAAAKSERPATSSRKLTELDAVRGIAALVVFNLHFLGGVRGDVLAWLRATPLFCLANGGPAVMLFFVLSGFVLTLSPLRAGLAGPATRPYTRLLGPVIRRYPRLAGPVVVTALLSIVLALTGGFPGVGWIAARARRDFPLDMFWGSQMHNDAAWPVLREAAFGTFVHGSADHNPVLWTMKWELLGSALAFALAFILLLPVPRAFRLAGACLLSGMAAWQSIWMIGFPIGVAGAVCHLRHGHTLRMPGSMAAALFFAAAFLMSWDIEHGAGVWRWANAISPIHRNYIWTVLECAAGACMLGIALYCAPARQLLRTRFFRALGVLSFPLYLMHFFALLSFGTWACLAVFPNGVRLIWLPAFYVAMLAITCAMAYPVAVFDQRWTRLLSRTSPR